MEAIKIAERLKKFCSQDCHNFRCVIIDGIFTDNQLEKIAQEFNKITSYQIIRTQILVDSDQTAFFIY